MKLESRFEKEKRISNIVTVVVALLFMIALGTAVYYFNTDEERARSLIERAGRDIDDYDYGLAVEDLHKAYELDPDNPESNKIINDYLSLILEEAETTDSDIKRQRLALAVGSFESEALIFQANLEKAKKISSGKGTNTEITAHLEKAGKYMDEGNYEAAAEEYAAAISYGADETVLGSEMRLNAAYIRLLDFFDMRDRAGAAEYMGSVSFDAVKKKVEEDGALRIKSERYLGVRKKADGYVVIYGSLDSGESGSAAGIISSGNTDSVYEGEWRHGVPDGYGKLIIWNKDETSGDAVIITGTVKEGKWDGEMLYKAKGAEDLTLNADEGRITTDTDLPEDYEAGIPCFGGSDIKPEIETLHTGAGNPAPSQSAEEKASDKKTSDEKKSPEDPVGEEGDEEAGEIYPPMDVFDATVWPLDDTPFNYDDEEKPAGTLVAGTPARIIAEKGDDFYVMVGDKNGFISKEVCMINLPDVMQNEVRYDITNAYSSIYKVNNLRIEGVTGEVFYPYVMTGEGRFLAPLRYLAAMKLYEAEETALGHGRSFVIFDAYRPFNVSKVINSQINTVMKGDKEFQKAMTEEGNSLEGHIPKKGSCQNYGAAVDLALYDMTSGEMTNMQTTVHDIGAASKTSGNTSEANRLAEWMKSSGFSDIVTEWWHFEMKEPEREVVSFQAEPYVEGENHERSRLGVYE
ncbi:MAG: hypothetical protein K6G42_06485 [Lachnospiraceae bacterium]|nr:hypothetical protein [Lachnospiraceae bacterium]